MKLLVGTDSTWSLRAWICTELLNLNLEVKVVNLNSPDYKQHINAESPSGLVPALINETFVIHDSLAIVEYLNEGAEGALFPSAVHERALARSLCSELHSGFNHLRAQCPFTLQAITALPTISTEMNLEILRVQAIFAQAQLPYMFESAGAVDAFYSILAYRLQTYGITLEGKAGVYQKSLLQWEHLLNAIEQAQVWERMV